MFIFLYLSDWIFQGWRRIPSRHAQAALSSRCLRLFSILMFRLTLCGRLRTCGGLTYCRKYSQKPIGYCLRTFWRIKAPTIKTGPSHLSVFTFTAIKSDLRHCHWSAVAWSNRKLPFISDLRRWTTFIRLRLFIPSQWLYGYWDHFCWMVNFGRRPAMYNSKLFQVYRWK